MNELHLHILTENSFFSQYILYRLWWLKIYQKRYYNFIHTLVEHVLYIKSKLTQLSLINMASVCGSGADVFVSSVDSMGRTVEWWQCLNNRQYKNAIAVMFSNHLHLSVRNKLHQSHAYDTWDYVNRDTQVQTRKMSPSSLCLDWLLSQAMRVHVMWRPSMYIFAIHSVVYYLGWIHWDCYVDQWNKILATATDKSETIMT